MFAIFTALAGVAQAAGAPTWVKLVFALIGVLGAVIGLVLFELERRRSSRGERAPPRTATVPRSLPDPPMRFVNRHRERSQLDEVVTRAGAASGSFVAILSGVPGVGKTMTGRRWANDVRTRFPDGDLFADFSKRRRGAAVDVSGVLEEFIRGLAPDGVAIPATLEGRLSLFRELTAERKLLVLLDDVSEAAQVSQLRPGGAGSVVVATTYQRLDELHYEGAELVEVRPLSDEWATKLLVEMAGDCGAQFKEAGRETARILGFCGGLALPLCVCAARLLLGREEHTVASIAAELADENRRLKLLSGKGEYAGAAVFGFAYSDLAPTPRLVHRRLGLHPGIDLDPTHAALLAGLTVPEAKEQMEALVDTHLLEPLAPGRYRFHDLVRLHARECVEAEDPEQLREELLLGLLDWYRACIRKADGTIVPDRLRIAPELEHTVDLVPEFDSREAAFAWLETERANILRVLEAARDREWDDRVWPIVESLWPFHHNRRHYADWIDATEIGIECARRAGNRDAEGRLRSQLARAFTDLGSFERAHTELERAKLAVSSSSNLPLRGSIREFTGICHMSEGDTAQALVEFQAAREVFAADGNARGVAIQDYFIGRVQTDLGEYPQALRTLRSALETMSELGDRLFVGRLLLRLGQANRRHGEVDEAERVLREGIAVLGALGMRLEEAESYEELAAIAAHRGEARAAAEHREQARRLYREMGHPRAGEMGATRESPRVAAAS